MSSGGPITLSGLIGEWSRTQKLVFVFVQYTYLMYGWQSLEMTMLAPPVDFWCSRPDDQTSFNDSDLQLNNCSDNCPNYQFSKTVFIYTLTEKLEMVCDRSWLLSFTTTILMVSGMIMNLLAGEISDRFGRRRAVLLALLPNVVGSLVVLFTTNYAMLAVGAALVGAAYVGVANFSYVLLFELVGAKQRANMGVSLEVGFATGTILLGGVAWWLRHWFYLQLVHLGLVAGLLAAWFLPESPAWLLVKKRGEEAKEVIRRISDLNGTRIPQQNIDKAVECFLERRREDDNGSEDDKMQPMCTMKDLFLQSEYRLMTPFVLYLWFAFAFVFYGFSLNVGIFGENMFLDFILSSAVSFPAVAICFGLIRVTSLKKTLMLSYAATAVVCVVYLFVAEKEGARTAVVVLGWFFTSPALVILYSYTAELYPTEVRGKAIGLGNFMSRLGAALAPYAKELGALTADYAPLLLFGVLSALVVALMFKLPETDPRVQRNKVHEGKKEDTV